MIRCPLLSSSLTGQSYRLSFLAALAKQALCERFLSIWALKFAFYFVCGTDCQLYTLLVFILFTKIPNKHRSMWALQY